MLSVGLFSDEPVLFEGLKALLNGENDIRVESLAVPADSLGASIRGAQVDVVLIDDDQDLTLSQLLGIRQGEPEVRLLYWTSDSSLQVAHQMLEVGVRGIVRKNLSGDLLARCIKVVADGELWLERHVSQSLHDSETVRLTRREMQLLTLVAQGLSNKEISELLLLSEGTVKYYFSRLFKKVGVSDRFELALYGLRCWSGTLRPPGVAALPRRSQVILLETA